MNGNSTLNGVINIYKEKGLTSHDVVYNLRKILKTKKIGHAGTLDPNVTGVLPICVGSSTKISSYLMDNPKTYIGELYFGVETDTEDIWGNIVKMDHYIPSPDELNKVLSTISGKTISQIPPMYSALKVKGKKLYEIAREGKSIERKPRQVFIYDMVLLGFYSNRAVIKIKCSKGTYIRTLFKDIAQRCGTCGTMSSLIRTSAGGLSIRESLTLDTVQTFFNKGLHDFLITSDKALKNIEKLIVPDYIFNKVINGVAIKPDLINLDLEDKKEYLVFCKGQFIGIYRHENKLLKVKTYLYRGSK